MVRSAKLVAALEALAAASRAAVQTALDEQQLDQPLIAKLADLHGRVLAIKAPPPTPPKK